MTYRKQWTKDSILEPDDEGGQGRHLRQASAHRTEYDTVRWTPQIY